jgi:hypothetical protein
MQRDLRNTLDFLIVGRYACKWRLRSTLDSLKMNTNELRNTLDFSTVWMTNDMDVKKYSWLLTDEWIKIYSWSLKHMTEWKCRWIEKYSWSLNHWMINDMRNAPDFSNSMKMS